MRGAGKSRVRSEEHTSELQSHVNLVCRLLLEKKKGLEPKALAQRARSFRSAPCRRQMRGAGKSRVRYPSRLDTKQPYVPSAHRAGLAEPEGFEPKALA